MKTQNNQWTVVPLALLLTIGGIYGSTHITHADVSKPQIAQTSVASQSTVPLASAKNSTVSATRASSATSQSATKPSIAPVGMYSNTAPIHQNLGQSRPILRASQPSNSAQSSSADFFTSTGAKIQTGFSNSDAYNSFMSDFRQAPSVTGNGATANDWDNYLQKLQSDMGDNDTSNQDFNQLKSGLGEADTGFSLKAMFDPDETFTADHLKADLNKYGYNQFVPLVDSVKTLQLNAEHPAPKPVAPKSNVTSVAPKTVSSASNSTNVKVSNSVKTSSSTATNTKTPNSIKAPSVATKTSSSASSRAMPSSKAVPTSASSQKASVASQSTVTSTSSSAVSSSARTHRLNLIDLIEAFANMPSISTNPVSEMPSVFPSSSAVSASSASSEPSGSAQSSASASMENQKEVNDALNDRRAMIKRGISKSRADLITQLELKPNVYRQVEKALGYYHKTHKAPLKVNARRYVTKRAFHGRKRIVKLIRPCHMHRALTFRKNMTHLHLFRRGTRLHVKAIKQIGHVTRIQLWNNSFITADKRFVKVI